MIKINKLFRPLPLLVAGSVMFTSVVGSIAFVSLVYKMDMLTFIASFNTPQITAQEFKLGKVNNPLFVDVRTPAEFAEDHIAGSVLVPITDIDSGLGVKAIEKIGAKHPQDTMVLYCTMGPRSIRAYQKLEGSGFKFVVLKGGLNAWRKEISPQEEQKWVKVLQSKGINGNNY